jgi:hypothetical protein
MHMSQFTEQQAAFACRVPTTPLIDRSVIQRRLEPRRFVTLRCARLQSRRESNGQYTCIIAKM